MKQQLICFNQGKHGGLAVRVSETGFHKVICLAFALLATLMLFNCGRHESDQTARISIEKARVLARQNNTWKAITDYRDVTRLDPENDTAYFELAENLVVVNSIDNAIEAYKKAAAVNPKNKYAKLRLGQIYLSSGKISEAREIISSVLATYPQDIETYHLLSSIEIMEKNFDSAIEILKKAMLIAEENIKTRLTLASLYKVSSKQGLAEAMYKDVFVIDPSLRLPYMELCKLYRKDKAWGKMEALLLQVLKTPGIREVKLTDLARFYEGQKKYSTAQTYYDRAVDEFPKSIQALMNLAEFHTRRNNRDNAITTMKKAVKLQPDNLECLIGLAQIYLAFDMPNYSWHEINKAVEFDNSNLDANFIIGKILMIRGDFNGAYDYISWVISQGFTNADAYHLRALCTKHKPHLDKPEKFRREKMKKDLQEALRIDPDMFKSRMELVEIYLYEHNIAKASEHLDFAFRKSPRNPKLLILMEMLKILKGHSIEKDGDTSPGHEDEAGNRDFAFGGRGIHEFVFKFYSTGSIDKVSSDLLSLAEFHTRRNNRDKAIATMEKAVNLSPDNIVCQVGLAQIYLAFDMPENAWYVIDKALEIDHYNLDSNFIVGKLLMKRGDFKGAYDYISWVINQGFTSADTYYLRALCTKYKPLLDHSETSRREKIKKDLQAALLEEAGNRGIDFDGIGIHEFVFKFHSTGSFNKVTSDPRSTTENKTNYAYDMELFSVDDKFKSESGHNFVENPVDMSLLAASLSKMDQSDEKVNFFWWLSYDNGIPLARPIPFNE